MTAGTHEMPGAAHGMMRVMADRVHEIHTTTHHMTHSASHVMIGSPSHMRTTPTSATTHVMMPGPGAHVMMAGAPTKIHMRAISTSAHHVTTAH